MENLLNNYALMYAFNNNLPDIKINRMISGIKPHYREDFEKIETYSTPAYRLSQYKKVIHEKTKDRPKILQGQRSIINDMIIDWEESDPIVFAYNSVGELCTFKMEPLKYNFPNLGYYHKMPPLSTFICFSIGKRPPNLIRLGKKLTPCRVQSLQLENTKQSSGNFYPSHPINLSELPSDAEIIEGVPVYMQPSSILTNSKVKGNFIQGNIDGLNCQILMPNALLYPTIF